MPIENPDIPEVIPQDPSTLKIVDTTGIKTVEVKVQSTVADSRTWVNVVLGIVAATMATPQVQGLVINNPWLALGFGAVGSALNIWMLNQTKKGVVSKNVAVEN